MTHLGVKIIWEQFRALQLITQEVLEVLCFFFCLFVFFARICQLKVVLIGILLLTVQYLLVTNLLHAHHLVP